MDIVIKNKARCIKKRRYAKIQISLFFLKFDTKNYECAIVPA